MRTVETTCLTSQLSVTSFVLQSNCFTASSQQKSLFRYTEKAAEQIFTFKGKFTAKKGVSLGGYEFDSRDECCSLLEKTLNSLMRSTRRALKVICDAVERLFCLPSFTIYLFRENFPYYDAKNKNDQVCFS